MMHSKGSLYVLLFSSIGLPKHIIFGERAQTHHTDNKNYIKENNIHIFLVQPLAATNKFEIKSIKNHEEAFENNYYWISLIFMGYQNSISPEGQV